MKTLSLLLTGLLISCISFSKPTAKKEASHVTIENRRSNNLTGTYASPLSPFSTEIDQELINKKVNALNLHRMKFNQAPFSVKVVTLSPADYEAQKPAGSFAFDAGYVDASGKVFVSEPTTSAQQSTFTDINQAALYYVCQSFLQYYYQTTEMPIWFKSGFASYEADMRIDDVVIKTAYQNYGGTLTSFSALNNPTSFAANNGFAVSYMFGEFMGVLKVWNYYMISMVNATTIIPFSWWDIKTVDQLFEIWMRYFNVRILEDNEQNRIKLGKESKHFKFYYSNSKDFWAAYFPGVLDNAITEYIGLLDFDVFEKFSYITMPECDFAAIGGRTCINRYTGGTAWSSGLSSTSPDNTKDFDRFKRLIRHELSHLVQRHLPAGNMTAWLNEGFAQFMSHKPHTQKDIDDLQSATNKTLNKAISYFGHLPTYEDTKVYPGQSNVDYYLLGEIMLNFIYQNGGYPAVKDVIMHPETGIANMGYSSVKAFMAAYYNFVNVVYLKKGAADYFNNYDAFITKLTNLTSSADSSTLLNAFWDDLIATGNFPFAIGTKVAFLYRGSASSINWAGMFNNWNKDADVGHRLGVSDIWMLEKEFPKDTRCEYKVVKNGSEWLADPNNPHPLVGSYNNSELWMPDYSKHTELIPQSGIAKGKLSANILKNSSKLGYTSQYRVYTPAGYTMLSGLPTIYVTDGQNYLDNNMGKMITVLDNLIADGTIQPVIAIFLDPRDPNNLSNDRRGNEYRNNINFAKYVTLELIPDIDAAYKTNTSADARAIMGASYGGYNAVYFGVAAADYFHKFGINSAYLHPNGSYNIDSKLQAANLDNLNFYLSYGTFDSDGERYFNRLKNIFDQKNSEYEFNIIGDGHTWQNWSRVIGDALEYFFPKPDTISLSLTSPNGGEYFIPGDTMNIKWNASGISDIKIEFSPDNGSNWSPISNSTAATLGSYDWTIPNTISNQCKIKITDITDATVFDESDNSFEIRAEIITSIYDIQYTTVAGTDGTYPSLLNGEELTVTGIVTATGYLGRDNSFFISEPGVGSWGGIIIYKSNVNPDIGDEVKVTGTVTEYAGFTEITAPSVSILSSGNAIPDPIIINTSDLITAANGEQFEGCLVKVENVTVSQEPDKYNQAYIDDGTGECQIDDPIFPYSVSLGDRFKSIIGVVEYKYTKYRLLPRLESDLAIETATPNNTGGPYTVDDNTVLLMHFDGDLTNNSALSGDGVSHGSGMSYGSNSLSNLGQSLNLDGSSYLTVPHNTNLNLSGDWTIELWFRPTEYNTILQYFVQKPGDAESYSANYALQINPYWDNQLYGFYFNSTDRIGVSDSKPNLNQWYHISYFRDVANSLIKIVLRNENWEIISTHSYTFSGTDVLLSSKDLRIGEGFIGDIDELRISNVVRDFSYTLDKTQITSENFIIYHDLENSSKANTIINQLQNKTDFYKKYFKYNFLDHSKIFSINICKDISEFNQFKPDGLPDFETSYVHKEILYIINPTTTAQLGYFDGFEQAAMHGFTKMFVDMEYNNTASEWMKYGFARYESGMKSTPEEIRAQVNNLGRKPTMQEMNNWDQITSFDKYAFAYTIFQYVADVYSFNNIFNAIRFGDNTTYYSFRHFNKESEFEKTWHFSLDLFYLRESNLIEFQRETEHFYFYMPDEDLPEIDQWASELEEFYTRFTNDMQMTIGHKIHIFFYPAIEDFQNITGLYDIKTGHVGEKLSIDMCKFTRRYPGDPMMNSIGLAKHELTHVIHGNLDFNSNPAWLVEGLASLVPGGLFSDDIINGTTGVIKEQVNVEFSRIVASAGRYPTIDDFESSSFVSQYNINAGNLYYLLGSVVVDYIIKTSGYLKLKAFIQSDALDYTTLGFTDKVNFMNSFYAFYEQNWKIPAQQVTAYKTPTEITIDGKIDETNWELSQDIKGIYPFYQHWSNNTAKYGVLWDDNYLYVAISVLDNNLINNSSDGWNDGVQVFIDADLNKSFQYDTYDRQFKKNWNSSELSEKNNLTTGVLHAVQNISGGYTVEMAIPWSNLGITPTNDKKIGFDIANIINDNGNKYQLIWSGNNTDYITTINFGELTLSSDGALGISDIYPDKMFLIYPNPASKSISISSPEIVTLSIFNLSGQKITERKNFSSGNIDVSAFKKGIYVIRFSCNKGVVSRKLIIE